MKEEKSRRDAHRWMLLQDELPVLEEIGLEDFIGSMLGFQQSGEPASKFLRLRWKINRFTYMHNN